MKKVIIPKKQKGMLAIPAIIAIVAIIVAVALIMFLGQRQPKAERVLITPSQLLPSVSAAEARTTICNLRKEGLFTEACQSKFDVVGKEDGEKIAELFTLLNKVQGDKSLSDYDRLLLSQAVFAALPNKDSPQTSQSRSSLLGVAYAQETNNNSMTSEEEFKKLMTSDLQSVVDSMPKGNNAWTIITMVSKHSWIDGKRQPIYSKQWAKSYDPFPNNPNVDEQNIAYQVSSIVGSRASSQKIYEDTFKGTSEMITYSFTMMSWKSQEYTDGNGPTLDDFHLSELNFSEEGYQGEDYLTRLIMSVKTPQPKLPTERSDKKESGIDSQTNVQKEITCEEYQRLSGSEKCRYWILDGPSSGLWCADTTEELYRFTDYGMDVFVINSRPPDYYTHSFKSEMCIVTKEGYERNR